VDSLIHSSLILNLVHIEAQVLTLLHPLQGPTENPSFERNARFWRYRTLGAACRDGKIDRMLVAHHRDDVAETVLSRIITGRTGDGLKGMRSVAEIPECSDMHGVSQSTASIWGSTVHDRDAKAKFEHGGVRILRPLLQYSKEDLIATCKEYSVDWFEDSTNKNPTLTQRNAIRHLLQNYRLPEALSKDSLVAVSIARLKEIERYKQEAERIFKSCKMQLDIRSGQLIIQFPKSKNLIEVDCQHRSRSPKLARRFLDRIFQLVSPLHTVYIRDIASLSRRLFVPIPKSHSKTDNSPKLKSVKFTHSSLQFELLEQSPRGWPEEPTWRICREPKVSKRGKTHCIVLPPAAAHGLGSPDHANLKPPIQTTEYELFDGRFWIRCRHSYPASQTLIIRMFKHTDKSDIIAFHGKVKCNKFMKVLTKLLPGDNRLSIPVLAVIDRPYEETIKWFTEMTNVPSDVKSHNQSISFFINDSDANNEDMGQAVALPTFGFGAQRMDTSPVLEWEWKYRHIDYTGDFVNINKPT
jgi:tRNA(Ile)-lysidine synthase